MELNKDGVTILKDSGNRQQFESGAVRDIQESKIHKPELDDVERDISHKTSTTQMLTEDPDATNNLVGGSEPYGNWIADKKYVGD